MTSLQNAHGQWDWTEGTDRDVAARALVERVEEDEEGLVKEMPGEPALKTRSYGRNAGTSSGPQIHSWLAMSIAGSLRIMG